MLSFFAGTNPEPTRAIALATSLGTLGNSPLSGIVGRPDAVVPVVVPVVVVAGVPLAVAVVAVLAAAVMVAVVVDAVVVAVLAE